MFYFFKLGRDAKYGERMDPIYFGGQSSRSQWTRMKISCEPNTDLTVGCFLIKLGRHINHSKPYWFWRSQFKGEGHDHDGYHWQVLGVRGCYALHCYIYCIFKMAIGKWCWNGSKSKFYLTLTLNFRSKIDLGPISVMDKTCMKYHIYIPKGNRVMVGK